MSISGRVARLERRRGPGRSPERDRDACLVVAETMLYRWQAERRQAEIAADPRLQELLDWYRSLPPEERRRRA